MRSSSTISESEHQNTTSEDQIQPGYSVHSTGEIAVVGIGPGSLEDMTPRARLSIETADAVVGYTTYIKLITELLTNKQVIGTAMMQEVERCQMAVDEALNGKKVAVVSSGDPGIYGMAGLILELVMKYPENIRPKVTVVPGITAVGASAAILGAPLMHDFAVISLSDLLTPWELIKKRAQMAAAGDFVIAIYNPKSKKRVNQIEEIREIVLQHRPANTPVGIVQQASRPGENMVIADLDTFTTLEIDMFSLVIIGNSQTYVAGGRMITPRGYHV